MKSRIRTVLLAAVCVGLLSGHAWADGFRDAVVADWAMQEQGRGRTPADEASARDALVRAERLLASLGEMEDGPDVSEEAAALAKLRARVDAFASIDGVQRTALYHEIRWLTRGAALKNPLFGSRPIAFLQRKRFICQMLHEYLGYFYDYADIAGGGVYLLENPGHDPSIRNLVDGRLPRGNYTTLSLAYDARTLYFGFAPRADEKPDYYSEGRKCFHIHAMNTDGTELRQLTEGMEDDFDPCPLPDGGLAFMSTRRGGFGRCHNPWEPLPAYTLHRMRADGTRITTLSFHETNEWHPSVLHDGTIVYSRWDYVDRSAAHFHGIWTSNPDGTNPRVLFGSYTQRINACFQPRAVPNSHKVVFVAGAHHADVGGTLVLLDTRRTALDPETGQDRFDAVEVLTPDVCFPEAPGWPSTYFHSPWPLSEDYFLVAYSHDPLPGMGPGVKEDTETGLYLFDRFGNLELLYRESGVSSMYPIPLAPRPKPPVVASTRAPALGDEGEFMLADVGRSHFGMPSDRPIRALRVFQLLPKSETHMANNPRLGYANAEPGRLLLGTVPVEPDGSAYFRAPARKALTFQAVDESGRAVQGMRSATYLQPGERRSCVGCHEPPGTPPRVRQPAAMGRGPSAIQPGPDGSRPWSFPRLVQPVLNDHCVRCHDDGEDSHKPCLAGTSTDHFTAAYEGLKPYVRWFEWGESTIEPIVTRPGRMPSVESPIASILADANHAGEVRLTDGELRRIYLWLDGNAAFYGAFYEPDLIAQRKGEVIPVPALQ
ncbi:MAG: hypothetical protein GY851_20490 [bacterium]|nr:hypothetical protein [bacterium]